jgi:heterodisulfide reductase subunit D
MFMLQNHWSHFYGQALPFDIIHITQLVQPHLRAGKLKLTKTLEATLTYHDPCYLSRGTRVIDEPRRVLAQIPGARLVELPHSRELSRCCGAGGGIRRGLPEVSIQMAANLLDEAAGAGADILVIDCPACYERLHLAQRTLTGNGAERPGNRIRIMDLMQVVTGLL